MPESYHNLLPDFLIIAVCLQAPTLVSAPIGGAPALFTPVLTSSLLVPGMGPPNTSLIAHQLPPPGHWAGPRADAFYGLSPKDPEFQVSVNLLG